MFGGSIPERPYLRASHLCILLVEDHTDTADLLSRLLHREGHEVVVARTLVEAMAHSKSLFDIIIADMNLPDGSGGDILRHFNRGWPLRAIAMSGDTTPDAVAQSHEAGFQVHLAKPVTMDQVIAAIHEVCAGSGRPRVQAHESGCREEPYRFSEKPASEGNARGFL